MPAPLVSVVTPFYNASAFLEEAIRSVLAQRHYNWELLLIDDGSTDGSTAIAKRYASSHPDRIRYLAHEGHTNLGKSTSRNLGLSRARGEYIAFLDADDVYLPEKLERQSAILASHPEASMVYGPTYYWYGWTGRRRDARKDFTPKLGVVSEALYPPPALVTLFLRRGGTIPCTCGLLARRSTIDRVGGFDETIQHMYEDQVLLAKLCLAAPVYVEAGCWDKYRQHPGSSSQVAIRDGEYHPYKPNQARLAYLTWLGRYLLEHKIHNPELWAAYRRALWPYEHPKLATLVAPAICLIEAVRSVVNMLFRLQRRTNAGPRKEGSRG
jgi:glycosyltransferase involved in cell wall biosynthesis